MAILSWRIGDVRITKVVELVAPFPLNGLLPTADPDVVAGHLRWLAPHFVDGTGNLLVSFHALVVESHGRRIVVDTCIGDDKTRPYAGLSDLHTDFLADLTAAGFPPDTVDTVVCTHLHFDHVGWNTRLVDGRWVPTFPNARYLLGRLEFEYWADGGDDKGGAQVAFPDSVQPLVDASLVDLVESDHRMTPEVCLEPSPGHTPGHHSVRIESGAATGAITGDLAHHPVQLAKPAWGSIGDSDETMATATRERFLAVYGGSGALVIGTHFAGPTAGRLVHDGTSWRLDCQ